MEIIDFHIHPYYEYDPVPSLDSIVAGLEQNGVSMACGSVIYKDMKRLPAEDYEEKIPQLNDRAYALGNASGGIIYPGIHVHPAFADMSCRELERAKAKGYHLVGELLYYMMSYECYATPGLIEILRYAGELGMVANFHPTDPSDMFKLCDEVKHTPLVWAHLSAYGAFDEHLEMMRRYENVYFDISAHGCDREGIIRRAIDAVGADRILFGTDYPGETHDKYIEGVMRECSCDSEREKIFSLNAKRLLGL